MRRYPPSSWVWTKLNPYRLVQTGCTFSSIKQAFPELLCLILQMGTLLFTGRTVEIGDEQETDEDMKENLHLLNLEIVEKIKD